MALLVAHVAFPTALYVLTSLVALAGAIVGYDHFPPSSDAVRRRHDFPARLAHWDGTGYRKIVADGYTYQPGKASNVAFFPLYPLLASSLQAAMRMRADVALVIVSNVCLLLSSVLFLRYLRHAEGLPTAEADLALLALGLWPTTVFFRLAYSESSFLLFMLLAMHGMQRGWRPIWIALLIGLTTGTRFVGIALVPPFLAYLWSRPYSRPCTRSFEECGSFEGRRGH